MTTKINLTGTTNGSQLLSENIKVANAYRIIVNGKQKQISLNEEIDFAVDGKQLANITILPVGTTSNEEFNFKMTKGENGNGEAIIIATLEDPLVVVNPNTSKTQKQVSV